VFSVTPIKILTFAEATSGHTRHQFCPEATVGAVLPRVAATELGGWWLSGRRGTGCRCSEASLDAFVLLDPDLAGGEAAWTRTWNWTTA
jgi:hypothetical protein